MSISERLNNWQPEKRKQCKVCILLDQLETEEPEEAAALQTALLGKLSPRAVSDVLKSEGYAISMESVLRHRRNHLGDSNDL